MPINCSDWRADRRPFRNPPPWRWRTVPICRRAWVRCWTPGRLEITNVALRRLILSAYGGQDDQISGDPPRASSDHYDIQARAEGKPTVQQMEGQMLQVLLEDRFRLKVHREIRQLPVRTFNS